MPLKADGTLDTEAMASMVFTELNTIYSAGTGGGASGGLDLGGYNMEDFSKLPFDKQMEIAYAEQARKEEENAARFQDALQRDRERAEQQATLQQAQNGTGQLVATGLEILKFAAQAFKGAA
jgi:hypothetical protein